MAQESCNLDKEEAEILKPSSPSSSPSPPQSSLSPPPPPPLFMTSFQEFSAQKSETLEEPKENTKSTAKKLEKLGNRCSSCRRKVGLTGFRCRCGDLFCGQHRYSDTHDCSFDYKVLGREQISKANPLIRAAKIIKI